MQALDRTQASLPMVKGRRDDDPRLQAPRHYHPVRRAGRADRHDHQPVHASAPGIRKWLKFLKTIDRQVLNDLQIHLICDNHATHKHEDVRQWLDKHPRFHLLLHPLRHRRRAQPGRTLVPGTDRQSVAARRLPLRARSSSPPSRNTSMPTTTTPDPTCGPPPPSPDRQVARAGSPSEKSAQHRHTTIRPARTAEVGRPGWWDRCGWLLVEKRSEPARGAAARLGAGQDRIGRSGQWPRLRW